MSKLVQGLAFGTPKFNIAPYVKINHRLVNLSCNCDIKSGLKVPNMKLIELSDSTDPDERDHNQPSIIYAVWSSSLLIHSVIQH